MHAYCNSSGSMWPRATIDFWLHHVLVMIKYLPVSWALCKRIPLRLPLVILPRQLTRPLVCLLGPSPYIGKSNRVEAIPPSVPVGTDRFMQAVWYWYHYIFWMHPPKILHAPFNLGSVWSTQIWVLLARGLQWLLPDHHPNRSSPWTHSSVSVDKYWIRIFFHPWDLNVQELCERSVPSEQCQ